MYSESIWTILFGSDASQWLSQATVAETQPLQVSQAGPCKCTPNKHELPSSLGSCRRPESLLPGRRREQRPHRVAAARLHLTQSQVERAHGRPSCSIAANQPVVEMVRWTVIFPTHQGSNPGARIISGFSAMRFQWEETFPSMTRRLWWLRKSQDDMPAQSLGGAHRGRVYVCVRS